MAEEMGLFTAEKRESQELCLVEKHGCYSKAEIRLVTTEESSGISSDSSSDEKLRSPSNDGNSLNEHMLFSLSSSREFQFDPNFGSGATAKRKSDSSRRKRVQSDECSRSSDTAKQDVETEPESPSLSRAAKKNRLTWSAELHQRFVEAVNLLGINHAVPKSILKHMNVPGLSRENIASHLQKYRISVKRKSPGLVGSSEPAGATNLPPPTTLTPSVTVSAQAPAAGPSAPASALPPNHPLYQAPSPCLPFLTGQPRDQPAQQPSLPDAKRQRTDKDTTATPSWAQFTLSEPLVSGQLQPLNPSKGPNVAQGSNARRRARAKRSVTSAPPSGPAGQPRWTQQPQPAQEPGVRPMLVQQRAPLLRTQMPQAMFDQRLGGAASPFLDSSETVASPDDTAASPSSSTFLPGPAGSSPRGSAAPTFVLTAQQPQHQPIDWALNETWLSASSLARAFAPESVSSNFSSPSYIAAIASTSDSMSSCSEPNGAALASSCGRSADSCSVVETTVPADFESQFLASPSNTVQSGNMGDDLDNDIDADFLIEDFSQFVSSLDELSARDEEAQRERVEQEQQQQHQQQPAAQAIQSWMTQTDATASGTDTDEPLLSLQDISATFDDDFAAQLATCMSWSDFSLLEATAC